MKREQRILRVAIIGCGNVAKHHIRFITETKSAQVIGLADKIEEKAWALGKPYGIRKISGSLEELLDSTTLDALHISTPPDYHYAQAVDAITRGIHVFIEKPVVFFAREATDLYSRAAAKGVLICPDFIHLFHPVFQHARSIINSGQLGNVVHVESHWMIHDPGIPELQNAMGPHWRYELPGGILHNNITHPLYLVLCWIGMPKQVTVSAISHKTPGKGLPDHLNIMLEGDQCTAYVMLSSVIGPQNNYVQVFCEKGVVLVNFDTLTVLITRKNSWPRSLDRATSNFRQAYQLSTGAIRNITNFIRGRLVPYQGLQTLISQFYASINASTAPPVSQELAIAVTQVEERVFEQFTFTTRYL